MPPSFTRRVAWTAVAIAVVFAVGTIGFHALLNESWHASFYRTVITATLTGLDSQPRGIGAELLTITMALTGVAIFGYLATQAVEAIAHEVTGHTRRERRQRRMIDQLEQSLHHLRLRPCRPPRGRGDGRVRGAVRRARREPRGARRSPASAGVLYVEGSGTDDGDLDARRDRPRARADRLGRLGRRERLHHAVGALAAARPDDRRARVRRRGRAEAAARRRRPRRAAVLERPASRWRSSRSSRRWRRSSRSSPRTAAPTCASRRSRSTREYPQAGRHDPRAARALDDRRGDRRAAQAGRHVRHDARARTSPLEVGDVLIAIGTEAELRALEDMFAPRGRRWLRTPSTASRRRSASSRGARSTLERPKDAALGDYATNVALQQREGARPAAARARGGARGEGWSSCPRSSAPRSRGRASSTSRLADAFFVEALAEIGEDYGGGSARAPERVQVELVSANPTGPVTVASARNGAYGDSVARLLAFAGHTVEREYYFNDAGAQMERFRRVGRRGAARRAAARGRLPRRLHRRPRARGRAIRCRGCSSGSRRRSSASASTSTRGRASSTSPTRSRRRSSGSTRTRPTARSGRGRARTATTKDRAAAALRATAARSYFASDVAYLLDKFERGFDRAIYVLGADHHGYVARLKAAARDARLRPGARRGAALPVRAPDPRRRADEDVEAQAATSCSSTTSWTRSASTRRAGTS